MTQNLRVFVACPGDVAMEKDTIPGVVDELNVTIGPLCDCSLDVVRWETHTAPGIGRPQAVITEQIGAYDIFVGIMWRRFGTPTGVADSGTEEEFRIAYEAWKKNPDLVLMFYFSMAPFYPQSVDELEQMRKVLLFRQELDGKALTWSYDSPGSFEAFIRKHLSLRIPKIVKTKKNLPRQRATPNDESVTELKSLWDRMSPDLKDAFSIAYNENRLAGDPGIKTKDLFAALLKIGSPSLKPIISEIPAEALPDPTSGLVSDEQHIVSETPWLSHCIESSIKRLNKVLPEGRLLTAADIFADIAKKGSGSSVKLLREHDIGPEEIDQILAKQKVKVVGA